MVGAGVVVEVVDVESLAGVAFDVVLLAGVVVDVVVPDGSVAANATCAVDIGTISASAAPAHTFFQRASSLCAPRCLRARLNTLRAQTNE